jgi:hypothetical protein
VVVEAQEIIRMLLWVDLGVVVMDLVILEMQVQELQTLEVVEEDILGTLLVSVAQEVRVL